MEPEGVAPSPYRIKSPVPVYCGIDSVKLVGERGLAPPRLTDSRSVGSALPAEPLAQELEFPAGLSPATLTFARSRSDNLSYGNNGAPGRTPTGNFSLRMAALW